MKHIHFPYIVFIFFSIGRLNPSFAQQSTAHSSEVEKMFTQLISNRLKAYSTGDSLAYRALVTSDFVHIDDRGRRRTLKDFLPIVAANHSTDPTLPQITYTLSNVAVRLKADVAVAEAIVTEEIILGSQQTGSHWRESNVYLHQKGHWLLTHHAETPIAGRDTISIPVDSTQLADLVGDYQWWPGYVERFSQRGSQLFGQESEKSSPWPFKQSAPGVFFPQGDPTSQIIFMRDHLGKVTYYLVYTPGWPLITARKIR